MTEDFSAQQLQALPSKSQALPSMPLMNVDVATTYSWVSAASDGLHDEGTVPNENNIFEVLCSWKKAPPISLQQIKDIIQTRPEVLRNTLDIKY